MSRHMHIICILRSIHTLQISHDVGGCTAGWSHARNAAVFVQAPLPAAARKGATVLQESSSPWAISSDVHAEGMYKADDPAIVAVTDGRA